MLGRFYSILQKTIPQKSVSQNELFPRMYHPTEIQSPSPRKLYEVPLGKCVKKSIVKVRDIINTSSYKEYSGLYF